MKLLPNAHHLGRCCIESHIRNYIKREVWQARGYIRRPCLALVQAGRRPGPPLVWSFVSPAPTRAPSQHQGVLCWQWGAALSHLQRLRSSSSDDIGCFSAQPPLQHRRLVWSFAGPAPRRPCWQSGAVFLYGFEIDLWHLQRLCIASFSLLSHPCRPQGLCGALSPQHQGVRAGSQTLSFCTVSRLTFGTFKGPTAAPETTSSFSTRSHPCSTQGVLRPSTKACSASSQAQSFCTVPRLTFGTFKGFAAAPAGYRLFLCSATLAAPKAGVELCSSSHTLFVRYRDWPFAPSKAPQQLQRRHRLFLCSATLAAPKAGVEFSRPSTKAFLCSATLAAPKAGVELCSSSHTLFVRYRDWPFAPSKAPQQLQRRHRLFLCSATLAAPKAGVEFRRPSTKASVLAVRRSLFVRFRDWPLAPSKALQQPQSFSMLSHPCRTQAWCGALSPQHKGVRAGSQTQSFCTVSRLTFGTFKGPAAGPATTSSFSTCSHLAAPKASSVPAPRRALLPVTRSLLVRFRDWPLAPSKALQQLAQSFCTVSKLTFGTFKGFAAAPASTSSFSMLCHPCGTQGWYGALSPQHQGVRAGSQTLSFCTVSRLTFGTFKGPTAAPETTSSFSTLQQLAHSFCTVSRLTFRTFKGSAAAPATTSSFFMLSHPCSTEGWCGAAPATTSAFSLLSHPCSTEGWCGALPAQHQGVRAGLTFGTFKGFAYRLFLCSATLAEPKACVELCLPSTKASVLAARHCLFVRFRDWPLACSKALQQLQRRPRLFLRAATLAAPKACSVPAPRRALLAVRRNLLVRFRDCLAPSKALQQLQPDIVSFYAQPPLQHPRLVWSFAAARTLFLYGIETDLSHLQRLRSSSSDDIVFFYAQPPLQHRRLVWSFAAPAPRRPCWQSGAVFLYGFETDLWHLQRLCSSSSLFLCSATLAEPKPGVELCLPSTKASVLAARHSLFVRFRDWPLAPSKALQQVQRRPRLFLRAATLQHRRRPPSQHQGVLCCQSRAVFLYGFETDLWHLQRLCSSSHSLFVRFRNWPLAPSKALQQLQRRALPPLRHPRLVWSFVSPAPRRPCWQSGAVFLYGFETDLWHLQRLCSSSSLFLCSATLAEPKPGVELCLPSTKASVLAVRHSLFVRFRDWPLAPSKALQQVQRRPRLFLRAATLQHRRRPPSQHQGVLCCQSRAVFLYGFETDLWHLQRLCSSSHSLFVRFRAWPLAPSQALQQLQKTTLSFSTRSHPCSTQGVLRLSAKACSAGSQAQSFCTVSRLTFGTFKGLAAAPAWYRFFLCSATLAAPKAGVELCLSTKASVLAATHSLFVRFRDWPLAPSKALQQVQRPPSFCTLSHPCSTSTTVRTSTKAPLRKLLLVSTLHWRLSGFPAVLRTWPSFLFLSFHFLEKKFLSLLFLLPFFHLLYRFCSGRRRELFETRILDFKLVIGMNRLTIRSLFSLVGAVSA